MPLLRLDAHLPLPAYDCVMKCSHAFNLLDSRGAISATERANYILRVRTVAKDCCEAYLAEVAGEKDDASTRGGGGLDGRDAKDFLLEIGCEEMPSAPLNHAVVQLGELVRKGLDEAGLAHGKVETHQTPRRLISPTSMTLPLRTEELNEVKRGPAASIAFDANGAPTKAAQGFARKFGVDASQLARRVDSDGREYVFAEKHVDARPATPILSTLSEQVIGSIEWPNYRSQRWGSEHQTFVRPIRWICALLGSDVVPAELRRRHERRHHARAPRTWRWRPRGQEPCRLCRRAARERRAARGRAPCHHSRGHPSVEAERPGCRGGHPQAHA